MNYQKILEKATQLRCKGNTKESWCKRMSDVSRLVDFYRDIGIT